MGTHPIFESDFDCLTEKKETKGVKMGRDTDAFASVSRGSLKLKTSCDTSGRIKKSKSKKKKSKKNRDRSASPEMGKGLNKVEKEPNYRFAKDLSIHDTPVWNPGDVKGQERTDADEEFGDNYRPTLTRSELKFFERQRKREMDRILLKASKSHKERVEDFNRKLADISELHFDIPKISWTK